MHKLLDANAWQIQYRMILAVYATHIMQWCVQHIDNHWYLAHGLANNMIWNTIHLKSLPVIIIILLTFPFVSVQ